MDTEPTLRLASNHLVVDIAERVGPRILGLRRPGGENLFASSDLTLDAGGAQCRLFGGHRLWRAPEVAAITWTADDGPVDVTLTDRRVVVTGSPSPSGVRASIEVELDTDAPAATVRHRLTNDGPAATALAPWALSMLRPGGTAILPLDRAPTDDEGLQASASRIVLWPYSDLTDPAIGFTADSLTIDTARSPAGGRNKLGVATRADWCAYLLGDTALVTRAAACESPVDAGATRQVFWQDDFVELETLGPLTDLAAGETVEHVERWELVDAESLVRHLV